MIFLLYRANEPAKASEPRELLATGTVEWEVYDTAMKSLRNNLQVELESVLNGKLTSAGRNRLFQGSVGDLIEWAVANRMPKELPEGTLARDVASRHFCTGHNHAWHPVTGKCVRCGCSSDEAKKAGM